MAASAVLAFWGATVLLVVAPGPDWAFILGCAAQRRSVAAATAGLAIGYTVMTIVVAAGLGVLLAHSRFAMTSLTMAGGGYLLYLGAATLLRRTRSQISTADHGKPIASNRVALWQGVAVAGLNPKALLIFVALLPQFTNPSHTWPVTVQLAILGMIFTGTVAAFYPILGTIARTFIATRPTVGRVLTIISGISLIVIAAALIIERVVA